ncbi:MAG: glycoside hydrolase family 3 domain protein, partial [Gemmatimonadetes bacterium]|nr:glycoside hydrolase family 3 domain protein [Gemmatimonadota bacterium]
AAARVEALIGAMTMDEKISMVRGGFPGVMGPSPTDPMGEVGYMPGVPRLGIPSMRLTDGPAGVRIGSATTALPAPVALAATFSTDHARQYGSVLGREARATRQDVIYGPMMNIVRVPQAGRNFETIGEDPLLASRLAEAEIRAIQAEGVMATAKHFAENNQENERQSINVIVDERTLEEIELPAFEASVKAGVGSVMCSYNRINGLFGCENPPLLTGILRNRWGFDGFVVSDYGANHSTVASLAAGMDAEFMSDRFATLRDSLQRGRMPATTLDWAVRHILTAMNRFGLLANASPSGGRVVARPRPALDTVGSARVARLIATDGAVLLKNGGALPVRAADLRSVVVIGPSARHLLVGGGGSSRVAGFKARERSPLDALTQRAGRGTKIEWVAGLDLDGEAVPASALTPAGSARGAHGLLRTDLAGRALNVDQQVDFLGDHALPPGSRFTWTGTLFAPTTGDYDLGLQTDWGVGPFLRNPGGNSAVFVDSAEVASNAPFVSHTLSLIPTNRGLTNAAGRVHLTAGPHAIRIVIGVPADFSERIAPQPVQVRLAWVTPTMRRANIDAAVAAARRARTAIVFAHNEGTEGVDRPSLSLPLGQDELIDAVAAANPRTVVVVNTGDPVLMPWAARANAILQMWYPGQEGGDATADLLLGRANPGGKLPVTFPAREADAPTAMPERYPGVNGQQRYSEGIFLGYRWYDAKDIAPLFPFGHGLSYTKFAYSGLAVRPAGDGYDVSFRLRNTGARRGAEVPQLYVGAPTPAPVPMAAQALAAFERVELAPGEERAVTLHVGPRQLSYWSTERHDWVVVPGSRAVKIGSSSRDVRLQGTITVGH